MSDNGRLVGMTPEGEFFVQRLRLNRLQLVAYRRARRSEAELTTALISTRQRIEELERTVLDLRTALEAIAGEIEQRSKRRS
jgi:hypothetical protein